jgi:putative transposase
VTPARITTEGHDAYPRALRPVFGAQLSHRPQRSLHNHLEQDHRGINQRYGPLAGFQHRTTAARFCRVFDAVRAVFRPQVHRHQALSLAQRRSIQQARFTQWMDLMATA